jgi:uncharacterized membrane protein
MSVNNHRLFETSGWDLAVFDHGIWQWSNFKFPYSNFHDLPWLADHFHPILVLLVPVYWVFPDVRGLLVAQAFLVSFGALPLYLLAKRVTKNHLFSLVLVFGYLTYFSLQWHIFSDFHELTFLPLTLCFTFYFWETKKKLGYWLAFFFTLLVKEETGLILAAFAFWTLFRERARWREALLSMGIGLFTPFFLIYFLMPKIGGVPYRHFGFGEAGETLFGVLGNIIRNPLLLFKAFVDSPVKINTMFTNFWPWAFLPLFSPPTLILAFQQYAVRFLDYGKVIRWTPYFAYSLPIAVITAWGSIYGFKNLQNYFKKRFFAKGKYLETGIIFLILLLCLFQQWVLHAPINSIAKKAFYRTEKWMEDNQKVFSCIPEEASLSAQNSLAPHLSQREKIKVFPEGLKEGYDYLVFDLHSGQSENSFFFFGSERTKYVADDIVARGLYKIVCREGDALVLSKIADTKGKLDYPFPIEIYER